MRRLSPGDFESALAEAVPGTRDSLDVDQIAPFAQQSSAYVPIRVGHEADVHARLAEFPDALGYVLAIAKTDDAIASEPEFFASLAPGVTTIRIGHAADRTYAGYGAIVAELRALAPHLENARWTIAEGDSGWTDDFRLANGCLSVDRWRETGELESHADVLEAIAAPNDELLRTHAKIERVREAASLTSEAFYRTGSLRRASAEKAIAELDRAAPLPTAAAQRALLELVLGEDEAAEKRALKTLSRADVPLARFVAALVALEEDRPDDVRVHAVAATRIAPWMAEAHLFALDGDDGSHARALVTLAQNHADAYPGHAGGPWNQLRIGLTVRAINGDKLDPLLLRAAEQNREKATGAALLLFVYGEALRLANAHARARPFFENALRYDSLNGEIETRMAWLKDAPR